MVEIMYEKPIRMPAGQPTGSNPYHHPISPQDYNQQNLVKVMRTEESGFLRQAHEGFLKRKREDESSSD